LHWRRSRLIEHVGDFETFLRLHGTPLPHLAKLLGVSLHRLRGMWALYRAQHPRALAAWHWTNQTLPIAHRLAFINTVKRALDRVPDNNVKVRPSAELVNHIDAHLAPAIEAHARLTDTDEDAWPQADQPQQHQQTQQQPDADPVAELGYHRRTSYQGST
jgi:hypothetical protein